MRELNSFQVEDIFSITGVGTIATGKMIQGSLRKGMKCIINGKQSEILSIEAKNETIETLTTGVSAGLLLSNVNKADIKIGDIYNF